MKKAIDINIVICYIMFISRKHPVDEATVSLFDNLEIKMNLNNLRRRAQLMGVRIETEKFDVAIDGNFYGYWLVDEKTNNGVWPDDNYCTNIAELKNSLDALFNERFPKFDMKINFMKNPLI